MGIQNGKKTPENLGVLWRTAQNLGASYIFTIGNHVETSMRHPQCCKIYSIFPLWVVWISLKST
jgi:hypothetical protein